MLVGYIWRTNNQLRMHDFFRQALPSSIFEAFFPVPEVVADVAVFVPGFRGWWANLWVGILPYGINATYGTHNMGSVTGWHFWFMEYPKIDRILGHKIQDGEDVDFPWRPALACFDKYPSGTICLIAFGITYPTLDFQETIIFLRNNRV